MIYKKELAYANIYLALPAQCIVLKIRIVLLKKPWGREAGENDNLEFRTEFTHTHFFNKSSRNTNFA